MAWFIFALALIGSYLLGSINTAVIISKFIAHDDVREHGSGNAGMTNMMRTMGFLPGLITFLVDVAKGSGVCLLSKFVVFPYIQSLSPLEFFKVEYGIYYCAFLCIIGHAFPIFFDFRGGKGVATTLGIMLVCQWQTGLLALAVFIIVILLSRIVSLSSIIAGISIPLINIAFVHRLGGDSVLVQCLLSAAVPLFAIIMHHENIVRLIRGEEKKFTIKKN